MDTPSAGYRNWRFDTDARGIAWLGIDKQDATTNVLSRDLMTEFAAILARLERDPPRGVVLWSAKESGFVAGADIHEFPAIASASEAAALAALGQGLFARFEALPCPSVAVLNGTTLGGGLELAMAATWRLALPHDAPSLGLPEVMLGLHPGFGGTVRAVRLLGTRRGLELMLTGRSLTVGDAERGGLVDLQTTPDSWRTAAVALLEKPRPERRMALLDRILAWRPMRARVARSLRRSTRAKARPDHYPAPYAMIDLWERHAAASPQAYAAEAESFGALAMTDASRNLVRVFFLQDRLKKLGAKPTTPLRHVHVVGAGVMGGDIAAWCAVQGLTVTLQDRELQFIEPALARAAKLFARRFRDPGALAAAQSRLVADVAGEGVAIADVVIEAIFENLDAKRALFAAIESRAPAHCLLATNTSSIPLDQIAAGLARPERLVGLHFFNPVAKLPLVEIVRAECTADDGVHSALAFARQIGKLPVPCRSYPGFLVNRILAPYMAEAMALAHEGVPLADIDYAAVEFGMPMGPVELADSVGLDIVLHVARILGPVLDRAAAPELEELVRQGHLGQKSGRGFYVYHDGKPVKPRAAHNAEINHDAQERLVMALLNEAAHCLHEGIVTDADLADAGVIFGTGFAPFRGGPLHYARTVGITRIVSRLDELAVLHGQRFRPSPGWKALAAL